MQTLTDLPAWLALISHQQTIADCRIANWFAEDQQRFDRFSCSVGDLFLDYSKNHLNQDTLSLLVDLANACDLKNKIHDLFSGQPINTTEKRPALHTALRGQQPLHLNGIDINQLVDAALKKMAVFTEQVRSGKWLGYTGKPIKHIVNIGIGGSHLGPLMATHALADYATTDLRCYFVSNIDSAHLDETLKQIDPETTLFIISSKSLSTLETLTNTQTIRTWLIQQLKTENIQNHFVAITAATDKALALGIPEQQIFPLWDWAGGRYSVWSAIGLPLALMIGMPNFLAFLQGARAMDEHFQTAPFTENMPVIMALLGIWYINFFCATSQAIIPYAHALNYLHTYLQQLDMESNGKSTTLTGHGTNYATGPLLWGDQGCNGQHAFYQSLHQGKHYIPVDFILAGPSNNHFEHHNDILIASGISQSQALLHGKSPATALAELLAAGYSKNEAEHLVPHQAIPGNRPNNVLFIKKITPYNLGALLALYEHKVFVQGAIWNINSFDQWGVELGKKLLPPILTALKKSTDTTTMDSSTRGLINHYKKMKFPQKEPA